MKSVLLLSLLLLGYVEMCHSQAYRPFLIDSAHWHITESLCVGPCDPGDFYNPNNCYYTNEYYLKLEEDTVLSGFTYKKIIQTNYSSSYRYVSQNMSICSPPTFSSCEILGLLWEDTTARKVYIKKINPPYAGFGFSYASYTGWCMRDSVLFDFSKQAGDTIFWAGSCTDTLYIVDSVNYSIPYFASPTPLPLKTWYIHSISPSGYGQFRLYESIGASVGFFGGQPGFEGPYSTTLQSYCIGTDADCNFSCSDPLGIQENTSYKAGISVYPNPVSDLLTVTLTNINTQQKTEFIITDILGREVVRKAIKTNETEISFSALSQGIYSWRLSSEDNVIRSGKITYE